jgi:acyl carrier protein
MESDPPIMKVSDAATDLVRECFRIALHLDPARAAALGPETRVGVLEGWDSLGHVKLVLELERVFDLEFDDLEILELVSLPAIVEAVNTKRR